ncbi:MAG TPA: IS21 family transposase [Arachnia sp.]|nr:IS21 family transposase [Arachnia sp.]HMR13151.1 IS21 family transposase [Arachnia sp.]
MTATWRSREELVHQVVTLAADGTPWRAISRAVGISRNTVRSILDKHRIARDSPHSALGPSSARAPRPKKTDAYVGRIIELLSTYPNITAQRVFEIIKDEGFDGGYTAVKRHLRHARPKKKPAPSLKTPDWGPGEMAESDWSPYDIRFDNGTRATVQAFSYVLPFSTRKFFALFLRCDLFALTEGHVLAFARFGGCASRCTYDSQKPVVLRWEGTQPIYNPRFLAFAAHYGFRPRAVRGDPNAKPRVERGFWELERSFLNGRSFRDLDDMRAQLATWLDRIVDARRGGAALERFHAEEQDKLLSLPAHPYDTARVVYRLASIDGFIEWEGNRYAVPYEHVTDILPVRITQRELFVYAADLQCVARHELAPRGSGAKRDPAGFHKPSRRQSPVDLDQLAAAFAGLGDGAARFFGLLSAGPARAWSHHARQILLLRQRFDTRDLDRALAHAARFGALEHRAVERILEARAAPRTLDEYVADDTARRLQEVLGVRRTEPRDLSEYDHLPVLSGSHEPSREVPPCPNESRTQQPLSPSLTTSSRRGSDPTSSSSA